MKIKQARGPARAKPRTVSAHVPADVAMALDAWFDNQPEPTPERAEAVKLALRDWLTGLGLLRPREDQKNLDDHIGDLEAKVADLKPAASGKPSPAKAMAMLRRGRAKSDLAKAKNKRQKRRQVDA